MLGMIIGTLSDAIRREISGDRCFKHLATHGEPVRGDFCSAKTTCHLLLLLAEPLKSATQQSHTEHIARPYSQKECLEMRRGGMSGGKFTLDPRIVLNSLVIWMVF